MISALPDRRRRSALSLLGVLVIAVVAGDPRPASEAHGEARSGPAGFPKEAAQLARAIEVRLGAGENVPAALARTGLAPADVTDAARALSEDLDTVNPNPGLELGLSVISNRPGGGRARLARLTVQAAPDLMLILSRETDGTLELRRLEVPAAPAGPAAVVVKGTVNGSLYLSIVQAGVPLEMAEQAGKLLSHRLDLSRDVDTGDAFELIFDGDASKPGALRYVGVAAHAGPVSIYGLRDPGSGRLAYVDDQARPIEDGLLRTPVDAARITSGFGMRLHPILGYSRMHQGVDFGAPAGASVFAAGDGVVEEARWAGGYGRWLKLRHAGGWETGYAHLSAFASRMQPGAVVHQGQVIGYVGSSGLATGPHLHYEVIRNGAKIDPKTATPDVMARPGGERLAELRVLKSEFDPLLEAGQAPGA